MNDKAVYRTAPATPGLLKIFSSQNQDLGVASHTEAGSVKPGGNERGVFHRK